MQILLIDDHKLVLSGLAPLFSAAGYIVSIVETLEEAKKCLSSQKFDLALLDINLGKENGLDLLSIAKATLPPRIILLSGITEQEMIFHGFELGALAFIPKSVGPQELLTAVQSTPDAPPSVTSGWIWASDTTQWLKPEDFFPKETILTPKERTVFMLMREGKLDKQIADELSLSIHTVRVHLRAIRRKRGHNRRSEQIF